MKRVLSVALGCLVALSGTVVLSPAASAYHGYDASATNVSYTSDNCFTAHVSISGFDTSDYASGNEIEVTGPGGSYLDGTYAYGSYTETLSPLLCNGIDVTGRYSVRVDGVEVTAFSVARPAISTRVVNAGSRRAAVLGRMTLRGAVMANRSVALQRLSYGSWSTVSSARTTSGGSIAGFCKRRGTLRGCGGYYRFNFNGVAVSKAFHLPKRRR